MALNGFEAFQSWTPRLATQLLRGLAKAKCSRVAWNVLEAMQLRQLETNAPGRLKRFKTYFEPFKIFLSHSKDSKEVKRLLSTLFFSRPSTSPWPWEPWRGRWPWPCYAALRRCARTTPRDAERKNCVTSARERMKPF